MRKSSYHFKDIGYSDMKSHYFIEYTSNKLSRVIFNKLADEYCVFNKFLLFKYFWPGRVKISMENDKHTKSIIALRL